MSKIMPDYRAKRIDNGEWEYGFRYIDGRGKCYIIQQTMMWQQSDGQNEFKGFLNDWITEVDPATLCRNTTATMPDGSIIWGSDLLKFSNGDRIGEVVWYQDNLQWLVKFVDMSYPLSSILRWTILPVYIGSRHDNPELLGAK